MFCTEVSPVGRAVTRQAGACQVVVFLKCSFWTGTTQPRTFNSTAAGEPMASTMAGNLSLVGPGTAAPKSERVFNLIAAPEGGGGQLSAQPDALRDSLL